MRQQPFASPEEALKHYGVKGQKWGVRKEEDLQERMSIIKKEAEYNRIAGKIITQAKIDPNMAAAKYGPLSVQMVEAKKQADREARLKKIAIGAGIGVGIGALGFAAYKLNQQGPNAFGALARDPTKIKLKSLFDTTTKAYEDTADGLHINWNNGVNLPKGSILKRLSTVAEGTPRPDGFFAAHLDSDVESYKAVLPTFWDNWGVGKAMDGGFLNHYQANKAVRAPSGKESFEIFKSLIHSSDEYNGHFTDFVNPNGLRGLSDTELKNSFQDFSGHWVHGMSNYPHVSTYFMELKKRGYNAVIDFNDAGKLGKTPLRVIDGKIFTIVKNESQSLDDFYEAAKAWSPELVHMLLDLIGHVVLKHRVSRSKVLVNHLGESIRGDI